MRFLYLLMIGFFSAHIYAAVVYDQGMEFTSPPAGPRDTTTGIYYHGNCFKVSAGDTYNSIESSTLYKRFGDRSLRVIRKSLDPNGEGHNNCESWLKTEATYGKARNEVRYGYGTSDFQSWTMGAERWIRFSVYIPSNEGNYSVWNASTNKIFMMQLMGANPSTTHELSFQLYGGPRVYVEGYYGTTATAGTEIKKNFGYLDLKTDAWNDVLIRWRRGWETAAQNPTGHGVTKIWLNCADWTSCAPTIDDDGPNAIRWMADQYFKAGAYNGVTTWDHQHVLYFDAVKMAKPTTETESEMFDLMAADFVGTGSGGEDPPAITSVNSGAALTQNQYPVAITATNVSEIVGCVINGNGADERTVRWDRTAGTGVFDAGDISQYASTSATLRCYDEDYTKIISRSENAWLNANSTDTAWTGDYFGYTSGIQITSTSTTAADAYQTIQDMTCTAGNRCRFAVTYYVDDAYKDDMYFHVADNAVSGDRIVVSGTAGALTLATPMGNGVGTSVNVANRTLGGGVYRVYIWWTVTAATQDYKLRAGWNGSISTSHTMILLDAVGSRNWTTTAIDYPILLDLSVTDETAPTIDCGMTVAQNPQPDGGSDYAANIDCTTDELGGTAYAMITTTNTSPNQDAVIAATGAVWSANGPVTTLDFSFSSDGWGYQDLWGWIVHVDAEGNKSAVEAVTFDDGIDSGQTKKFKWSSVGGNAIYCYSASTNSSSPFTGEMSVIITDGDYFSYGATVTDLAYAAAVSFTNGEGEIDETDLTSGSINSLSLGDQGYNYWAKNSAGTCRVDNEIQVIAE